VQGSKDSSERHERALAEWRSLNQSVAPSLARPLQARELIMTAMEDYCRGRDGKITTSMGDVRRAVRVLVPRSERRNRLTY
jgi:hypothetical protein